MKVNYGFFMKLIWVLYDKKNNLCHEAAPVKNHWHT